jgi:hypothetical protein
MFIIDDIVGAAVKAVDGLTGGLAGKALDLATKNPLVELFESAAKQLGVPDEIVNIGELAAGICTGNLALAAHGGLGLLSDLAENARARTEYVSSPGHTCGGYSENKPRRSDESEYQEALTTLNKKFDEFDAFKCFFGGDGLVTQDELRHLVNSPGTPSDVKKAAEYFLEHPEKFNKLEVSAGIGGKDGLAGKLDVNAELAKVNEEIEASGSSGESSSPASFENARAEVYSPNSFQCDDEQAREIRKLLATRGMPMEAKIMLFATAMASKLDKAIDAQMNKVDKLAQKQTAGYAEGATTQQRDEAQGSSGSLQIEMQKLNLIMGLEKTLLEVASNAIQNYNQINGKIAGNTRV